jgi:hypothetical protein
MSFWAASYRESFSPSASAGMIAALPPSSQDAAASHTPATAFEFHSFHRAVSRAQF